MKGFKFMNNRFDQAATLWDKDQSRVHMAESIADVMIGHLQLRPDQVLLDFGAGTGLISLKLQPYVRKVIAVDTSPGMLNALREKLAQKKIENVDLLNGSIEDESLHFPAADVIISSMAFHHVRNTETAAKVFWKALKSGGQIAIADLDEDHGEFHADPNAAVHNGFNRAKLQSVFERAGFVDFQFRDAYTYVKRTAGGQEKPFTIFLMTANK
jgi:ubiquinone/menaquinone biosynthesis C-methylase UbiE